MMTYCKIMMTYCNEFLMTAVPLGFEGVQAQSIVCTLGGIDVQSSTRRIYLYVPRGILQLFLSCFLITEERFYQSATCTQEQEMTKAHQLVKFDTAVSNLHDRNSFLGRQEWNVLTVDSTITCKGYYFICNGGYL